MDFGTALIGRCDTPQLESLFDRGQLERFFPGRMLDFGRLSQLQWLTIEEEVEVDPRPEARAIPVLFKAMDQDSAPSIRLRVSIAPLSSRRCSAYCSRFGKTGRQCWR